MKSLKFEVTLTVHDEDARKVIAPVLVAALSDTARTFCRTNNIHEGSKVIVSTDPAFTHMEFQ